MTIVDIHSHMQKGDPNMDAYIANMDSGGVELALLHGLPTPGLDNDAIVRAVKKHPDRLKGSCFIDLRRPVPECIEVVRRYAGEGFRGVKLFPNVGYDPGAEIYDPFWEYLRDAKLMVLSHCGWLGLSEGKGEPRVNGRTASPMCFETPARRCLDLPFIMAHFGGGENYLQTLVYTSRLPNMYADVAPGWGRWVFDQNMPGLQGANYRQILYASDGPARSYGEDIEWWRNKLTAMGRSEEELALFFRGNAARLLGV